MPTFKSLTVFIVIASLVFTGVAPTTSAQTPLSLSGILSQINTISDLIQNAIKSSGSQQTAALIGANNTLLTDSFTAPANTLLEDHSSAIDWVRHPVSGSRSFYIDSEGRATKDGSGAITVYYSADQVNSADYSVEGQYVMMTTQVSKSGIAARIDSAEETFYTVRYVSRNQAFELVKHLDGRETVLGTSAYVSNFSDEEVTVRLEVEGNEQRVFINGVLAITANDSDISAAGHAGLIWNGTAGNQFGQSFTSFAIIGSSLGTPPAAAPTSQPAPAATTNPVPAPTPVQTTNEEPTQAEAETVSQPVIVSGDFTCEHQGGTCYYVSPSGNDNNNGRSPATAFRTLVEASRNLDAGDTLYLMGGIYRLSEQGRPAFTGYDGTARDPIRITEYPGERAQVFGSDQRSGSVWESVGGYGFTVYRTPYNFSGNVKGMWNSSRAGVLSSEQRVFHVEDPTTSRGDNADVSLLAAPNQYFNRGSQQGLWTIANASGVGCDGWTDLSGCYVYYRPPAGENPNTETYEFSTGLGVLIRNVDHIEVSDFEIYYANNYALMFRGTEDSGARNMALGHTANDHADNSYVLKFWEAGDSYAIDNIVFDSMIWRGANNSWGITYMITDEGAQHIVEGNELYGPFGSGSIGSKGGASNVIIRNNLFRDIGGWWTDGVAEVSIAAVGSRCTSGGGCAIDSSQYRPGGGWQVYGNLFDSVEQGFYVPTFQDSPNNGFYNNVVVNSTIGAYIWQADQNAVSTVANNIFVRNEAAILLRGAGSGSNVAGTVAESASLYRADNNIFYDNDADYRIQYNSRAGQAVDYQLAAMQSTFGLESNSYAVNPNFRNPSGGNYAPRASEALGTGMLGLKYNHPTASTPVLNSVNIGMFPDEEEGEGFVATNPGSPSPAPASPSSGGSDTPSDTGSPTNPSSDTPVTTNSGGGGGGGGSDNTDKRTVTNNGNTAAVSFPYRFTDTDRAARGSEGENVRQLQRALNRLGYTIASSGDGAPGFETNYFGPATERALQRFQADNGIVSSGDAESTGYGALGPSTRNKLNEKLATTTTTPATTTITPEIQARIDELLRLIAALQAILLERIANGE